MKNDDKFEQIKRAHELKYPLARQKLNFSPQNTMHQNAQRSVNSGQFPCPLIAEILLYDLILNRQHSNGNKIK